MESFSCFPASSTSRRFGDDGLGDNEAFCAQRRLEKNAETELKKIIYKNGRKVLSCRKKNNIAKIYYNNERRLPERFFDRQGGRVNLEIPLIVAAG